MKIAFDIDGVLNDNSSWFHYVTTYTGVSLDELVTHYFIPNYTRDQLLSFIDMYGPDIFRSAVPRAEFVECCRTLNELGHEVYFITSRKEVFADITAQWLRDHNFEGTLIHREDKGAACSELQIDIVIEDSAENAIDIISNSNAMVYLVAYPYNKYSLVPRLTPQECCEILLRRAKYQC